MGYYPVHNDLPITSGLEPTFFIYSTVSYVSIDRGPKLARRVEVGPRGSREILSHTQEVPLRCRDGTTF
jgi:hypothetical protein